MQKYKTYIIIIGSCVTLWLAAVAFSDVFTNGDSILRQIESLKDKRDRMNQEYAILYEQYKAEEAVWEDTKAWYLSWLSFFEREKDNAEAEMTKLYDQYRGAKPKSTTTVDEELPSPTVYRNVKNHPLPPVYGNTADKRFQNLVKYFDYNPQRFVNARVKYGVKEEVIACIVWADTWFMQLKSANNPWNVGNNDRWDVAHFGSKEDGIMHIADTLSNKYLGRRTKIWELSNWGRKALSLPACSWSAPCYATSGTPDEGWYWNVNVLDCLTFIYARRISEDFTFRK